jgi:hypothetical protein
MKKLIPALLCLALITGCKKDDSQSPVISKAALAGKWYATKMKWTRYTNFGVIDSTETIVRSEDNSLQLNNNGTAVRTIKPNGLNGYKTTESNLTYSTSGSEITFIRAGGISEPLKVDFLNSNSFVMGGSIFVGAEVVVTSITYNR